MFILKISMQMPIAALFTIVKGWKLLKYPWGDKWVEEVVYP